MLILSPYGYVVLLGSQIRFRSSSLNGLIIDTFHVSPAYFLFALYLLILRFFSSLYFMIYHSKIKYVAFVYFQVRSIYTLTMMTSNKLKVKLQPRTTE